MGVLVSMTEGGRRVGGDWLFRRAGFVVESDELVWLRGPSGVGKTTLLRCLACLSPLDEGVISFKSQVVERSELVGFRSQVIYCHQNPVLLPGTVADNLNWPFTFRQNKTPRQPSTPFGFFDLFGLPEDFLDRPVSEISGGQAQVLSLWRALQLEPRVILLDEPMSALDADRKDAMWDFLCHWKDGRDRAIVFTHHGDDPGGVTRTVDWGMLSDG